MPDCTRTTYILRYCGLRNKSIIRISDIARRFELPGDSYAADVFGSGHIHETFLLSSADDRLNRRFVLQHINNNVFTDPDALMSNVGRVVEHIEKKIIAAGGDTTRGCLRLIPATDGKIFTIDTAGGYWRIYHYIENAESVDQVEFPAQAFEAAAAFGRFQALLVDLPAPPLNEVIADFHNTPTRVRQLEEALERDEMNRARLCQPEIEVARRLGETADALVALQQSGEIPQRVVHNDTKINNVLFDSDSRQAVCVIDLDTVMPGLSLFDFGDLVRTATMPVEEDETDLSLVEMQVDVFDALVRGYLSTAGEFLNPAEIANLHCCGRTITAETGVRFLTDYLNGDKYFKVSRLYQNLSRCRTQFALVESIDRQASAMQEVVATATKNANIAT